MPKIGHTVRFKIDRLGWIDDISQRYRVLEGYVVGVRPLF